MKNEEDLKRNFIIKWIMTKWFDWLAGLNLLMIGTLMEIVDWKIKGLLQLRHPVNILLLIISVLLATGLSIIALNEYKDARKTKKQKKVLRDTGKFIVYVLIMFALVYFSWFLARIILLISCSLV